MNHYKFLNINKFLRFIFAGLANTVFGILIFWVAEMALGETWLSLLISLVSGIVFNFINYGKFVYKFLDIKIFPKFVVSYMLIYILNLYLLKYFSNEKIYIVLLQGVLALPVALFSYILMTFWVFRKTLND